MATIPPPPSKRQKTAVAALAAQQAEIEAPPEGSVRIQFVDRATGKSTGPSVSVQLAHATVKNLELLLNEFKRQEDPEHEQLPYRFFHDSGGDVAEALGDGADIYNALVKKGTSTEEEIVLQYSPQAVFRVRAVSRCSASISGMEVLLFLAAIYRIFITFTGHGEAILATQFSPASSSKMVSGSGDSTARIWDCDTGTPLHTLKGHTSWVLAVSWSPDDSTIATGSMDNTVRLWDAQTGKPLGNAMKGHSKWVTSLSWEPYWKPDDQNEARRPRIASSSKDATVRIWNAGSKQTDMVLSGHKDSVTCVKWGGMGYIYTASLDRTIKIWDALKGTLVHTLTSHAHRINHLALSTDFVLRTGYHDHTRQVPATEKEKRKKAKDRFENAAKFNNRTVERLISASDDLTMYLWEPTSSTPTKPVARLMGHQKAVNHVTFSPDGLYIASAGFDNHVKLWQASDGKFIATLRGHVAPAYQCCFSPDSRLLVSASKDTTIKVWEVRTGKLKEDLPGHKDEVYAVDWSPDGEKVGSGGKDKAVRIWRH